MPRCELQIVQGLTAKDMKSISTYTSSVRYMRKVVPLVIYNIVYHRVDFDENLFVDNVICDIPFKTFKSKTKDHILADVFYWCKGVVDAIEKKYLDELHLVFKDKNMTQNSILEDYKFTFFYDNNPEPASLPTSKDVISVTKQLFQSVEALGEFTKMDKEIDIAMEMVFFDDAVEKYKPLYFTRPAEAPLVTQIPQKFDYNTIGYLRTGYHKMKCAVAGTQFTEQAMIVDGDDNDEVEIIEEECPKTSNRMGTEIVDIISLDETTTNEVEICNDPEELISVDSKDDRANACEYKCACGRNSVMDFVDRVKCTLCCKYQHLACVGYIKASSVTIPYICSSCHTDERPSFDKMLQETKPEDWRLVAFARLFLFYCYTFKVWPVNLLNTLERRMRKTIISWIKSRGFLNFDSQCPIKVDDTTMSAFFYDVTVPESIELENEEELASVELV
ncbi:putative regulation of homologous chromosome segregation [Trypoxylus dichotomus]